MKLRNLEEYVTDNIIQNTNVKNELPIYFDTMVGNNIIIGHDKQNKQIVLHDSHTLKAVLLQKYYYELEFKKYEFSDLTCWLVGSFAEVYILQNGNIYDFDIPFSSSGSIHTSLNYKVYYEKDKLFLTKSYGFSFEDCIDYYFDAYEVNMLTQKVERIFHIKTSKDLYLEKKIFVGDGFVEYTEGNNHKLFHMTSRKIFSLPVSEKVYSLDLEKIEIQGEKAIFKDARNRKYYICSSTKKCFVYDYEEYDEVVKFLTENNTKSVDFITIIDALAVDKSTIAVINDRCCIKTFKDGNYIYRGNYMYEDGNCIYDFSTKEYYFMHDAVIDAENLVERYAILHNGEVRIFKNVTTNKYYLFINRDLVYEFNSKELDKVLFNIRENMKCSADCLVAPIGENLCIWDKFGKYRPLVVNSSSFKKFE